MLLKDLVILPYNPEKEYEMKKIILYIIILSSVILYPQQQTDIPWPTLANSDWPMIKRDPQFTGRSPYRGPQTATIRWIVDMPHGIFSGPVIGENGNLYFGSYYVFGDYFYCYSPEGEMIWEYQTGSGRATQSGILIDSSHTIYFGSRDNYFYALNPDGTLKWKYETSGSIVQEVIPNIDLQGNLYVTNFPGRYLGELYSFSSDGNLNWNVIYDDGFAFKSPVLSPDGSTIYIAGVDSNLFALNLDGSIKWKFRCGSILRAPMVDSEGNIYFIPHRFPQFFYSLYPDGNIRLAYPLLFGAYNYAIPAIDSEGNIYAVDVDSVAPYYWTLFSITYDGNFRWSYLFDDLETEGFEQPLIIDPDNTVYIGSTYGNAYYAISGSGELLWKLQLDGSPQQVDNTSAISKDGTLYLGVHHSALVSNQSSTLIAIRDTVTSVKNETTEFLSYKLEQNFPNPFNATTHIRYNIPQSGRVTLKVYDLMGRVVSVLLDRYQEAGSYDVIFQPKDLASGIYFYTLTSGNFTATKKLILLK